MKFRLDKKRKKKPPSKLALALAPWRVQLIAGFMIVTAIGLLGTGIWYGSRLASLQIEQVAVVGGTTIRPEAIQTTVNNVLSGSYFRLVPHTFALLYPRDAIVAAVSEMSRVHHVQVERTDWHTLTVIFDEYQPVALACADEAVRDCYFIDRHGFAFTKAPDLTGGAMVRYVDMDTTPTLKQTAFVDDYMTTTTDLITRLEAELGLYVVKVIKRDDVDTSYILSTGAELKTSNRLSIEDTFTNLQSILTSEAFSDVADGSFHYIDLRFGDKVFVSESDTVATSTEAATEDTIIEE